MNVVAPPSLVGQPVCGNYVFLDHSPRPLGYVRAIAHLLCYARVSTGKQNPDLQVDELTAAGCWKVWVDHASGALDRRPQLDEVLAQLRPGDTLVVWRLDRLGRSLRHLIDVVTTLDERGVGFRSLDLVGHRGPAAVVRAGR